MKFINELKKNIKEVRKISSKKNKFVGFMIGNTTKLEKRKFYFTPIRITEKMVLCGVIVYSESYAKLAAKYIDGKVDYVLVDAEKKIPPKRNKKPSNIERRVREILKNSKLWTYKGNDLTVDAVDILLTFLMKKDLRGIGGKKIAVLGAGNIGTKISLLMVERGAKVLLTRKNFKKLKGTVETLNSIKPLYTKEKVNPIKDNFKAIRAADIIIGATNGKPVISKKMLFKLSNNLIIIDVGKGTLFEDALSYAVRKGINVYRVDISAALNGFINKSLMIERMNLEKMGRKKLLNETIVSGGLLGSFEEIIVDDIRRPTFVYGLSDGKGDFIRNLNKEQNKKILKIKKYFKIN